MPVHTRARVPLSEGGGAGPPRKAAGKKKNSVNMLDEGLALIAAALSDSPADKRGLRHVGRLAGRVLQHEGFDAQGLAAAYLAAEIGEWSRACPSDADASHASAVRRLASLLGAAPSEPSDDDDGAWPGEAFFRPLVHPRRPLTVWTQAFARFATLQEVRRYYTPINHLPDHTSARVWLLMVERRARYGDTGTPTGILPDIAPCQPSYCILPSSPTTVDSVALTTHASPTTHRLHHVHLPASVVATLPSVHLAISKLAHSLWVTPSECQFVHTLDPLWTRRFAVAPLEDAYVVDEYDGFEWAYVTKQLPWCDFPPEAATLWQTLQRWQSVDTVPWNYATVVQYDVTFEGKASESVFQPVVSAVLADHSTVVKVNVGPTPLHLHVRRFRAPTAPVQTFALHQGDALVLPESMCPLVEMAVQDPGLAETPTEEQAAQGPLVLTLMAAHPATLHTAEELGRLRLPDDAETEDKNEEDNGGGEAGLPPTVASMPALGAKTIVRAPPTVCTRRGRRTVHLPALHQLVAVHGRRFQQNPKAKHWFAIVSRVDTATGVVRVGYLEEATFDDIDKASDLMYPVDAPLLSKLDRFAKTDDVYAGLLAKVRDHIEHVRELEDAVHSSSAQQHALGCAAAAATGSPPCMRPVYASADQWTIRQQTPAMGDGLYVLRGARGTLFEYTTHAFDVDHLVAADEVDDARDTCAIVMQSAPSASHNVVNPREPHERGPGSYANAADYRWDAATRSMMYVSEEAERTHKANALLMEYDGKLYVRLTQSLSDAFVMVHYGETYAPSPAAMEDTGTHRD